MNATPPVPRHRIRPIHTDSVAPAAPVPLGRPTADMKAKAVSFFEENRDMNRLKTSSEKTRAALYQAMAEGKTKPFEVTIPARDGKAAVVLEVATGATTGTAIDPHVLYKVMDCAKDPKALRRFLDIVSAPKAAVVDALGGAVANRCEKPTAGRENVSVKPKRQ